LLRRANTTDPAAYRVLRIGLWLHLQQPPGGGSNGRIPIPPVPPSRRSQLEQMAQHGKWPELLEESESMLANHRFSLDLHRYSFRALTGLGATHEAARDALVLELAAFLRRFPKAAELLASDGTAVADPATQAWIQSEVLKADSTSGARSEPNPEKFDAS